MARKTIRSIIEELITSNPSLIDESDDHFIEVVRKAAKPHGYPIDGLKTWNLLRSRFAVKAALSGKSRRRLPKPVDNLLTKARLSALEAVASYNNPMFPFRSGSFIVHMHIAWNSLLLAIFMLRGVKPHYIDKEIGKPQMIDGEIKLWELSRCVKEYWSLGACAVSKNIEFFIGLRNKIEHSLMPELDLDIFGECQAHLINFENILTIEFGAECALLDTLAMSLQFSKLRDDNKNDAVRKLHKALRPDVKDYIDRFRSALSADIFNDMEYSFKVFLVPNTGNHRSKDSLAVEFVRFDGLGAEEADNYKKIVTLIKERHVPVANLDRMRAGDVAKKVASAIKPLPFTASSHHSKCWRYYGVRPPKGSPNPKDCNTKYCIYDVAHDDYVYTEDWVEFLKEELANEENYKRVMSS